MTSAALKDDEIQGPSVIRGHTQSRTLSPAAGSPKGWEKPRLMHVLYDQGKLSGGNGYTAEQRRDAGIEYEEIFLSCQPAGRDSTQALNAVRSGGGGGGIPAALLAAEAMAKRAKIDKAMSQKGRKIIEMVCGEGHLPVTAISLVCGDFKHTVAARFRDALDELVDALGWGDGKRRAA